MLNIIIHVVLFSIKTFIYVYKKVWHFIYHCKTFHLKSQPSPAIIPAWCQMMNEEASRRLQSPEFSQMKQRQDIILTLSKFLTYKFMNVRKMIVLCKKNTNFSLAIFLLDIFLSVWKFSFYWSFRRKGVLPPVASHYGRSRLWQGHEENTGQARPSRTPSMMRSRGKYLTGKAI